MNLSLREPKFVSRGSRQTYGNFRKSAYQTLDVHPNMLQINQVDSEYDSLQSRIKSAVRTGHNPVAVRSQILVQTKHSKWNVDTNRILSDIAPCHIRRLPCKLSHAKCVQKIPEPLQKYLPLLRACGKSSPLLRTSLTLDAQLKSCLWHCLQDDSFTSC
jgi:hypothetical protein